MLRGGVRKNLFINFFIVDTGGTRRTSTSKLTRVIGVPRTTPSSLCVKEDSSRLSPEPYRPELTDLPTERGLRYGETQLFPWDLWVEDRDSDRNSGTFLPQELYVVSGHDTLYLS